MADILEALRCIELSSLGYDEWYKVGMALKSEGYDFSVWDEWSSVDARYKPQEMRAKWDSFNGSGVTGGTIVYLAQQYGNYKPSDGVIQWNGKISSDTATNKQPQKQPQPLCTPVDFLSIYKEDAELTCKKYPYRTAEMKEMLQTLFRSDEWVSIATRVEGGRVSQTYSVDKLIAEVDEKKEFSDQKKEFADIIHGLNTELGAWFTVNPVVEHPAGKADAANDKDVTAYRNCLIEMDTFPLRVQWQILTNSKLPIRTLTYSGSRSIHAVVAVDAKDWEDYKAQVQKLYQYIEDAGVPLDKNNKNCSRLTRLAGVQRKDKFQHLLDTEVNMGDGGCKTLAEWFDKYRNINPWTGERMFQQKDDDGLPDFDSLEECRKNPPPLAPELISGILRQGHKMLIAGSSKAGKSFLLVELAVALASGTEWLGFQCHKSKVLYINLEIDRNSFINRILTVSSAMGCVGNDKDLIPWTLRGFAVPLNELVPKLLRKMEGQKFDAVIIDPIYKVITGDENNATEMGTFCNLFDRICTETGAAVVYCHHHSKGSQGNKKAMDRASGSGVFARDPDAQLDMIQLDIPEKLKDTLRDEHVTAWRIESSLREFKNITPVNVWFEYPLHRVDTDGLKEAYAEGSTAANLAKSSKRTLAEDRREHFNNAFNLLQLNGDGEVKVTALAEYLGITDRSVRNYVSEFCDTYVHDKGVVMLKTPETEN